MATTTTRLGLRKPAASDSVDVVNDLDANYDKIDAAIDFTICTSSTRPASPFQGQSIYETDTKNSYYWNGTTWKLIYTAESLVSNANQDLAIGFGGTGTVDAGVSVNSGTTAGTIGAFFRFLKNSVEKWRFVTPQNDPNLYIRDVPNGSIALTVAPALAASGIPGVALPTHHGFRNRLINSVGFPINQRNAGAVSAAGSFVCDRWFIGQVATGVTQSFQLGTASPGANADLVDQRYISWSRTVLGTVQPDTLNQRIESVKHLNGRVVTVTVRANTASGSVDLQCGIFQNFGTGGSPSAAVSTYAGNILTFTTAITTQSFQVTLPSIAGKTLGTNGDDNLELVLIRPLTGNTLGNLQIFAIQLEDGPISTPFEIRPIGLELQLCQRYYFRITGSTLVSLVGTGLAATATSAYIQVRLPQTMFKLPTLSTSSAAAMSVTTGSGVGVASTAITMNATVGNFDSVLLTVTVASGLTTKEPSLAWVLTTASNWIAFSAEL